MVRGIVIQMMQIKRKVKDRGIYVILQDGRKLHITIEYTTDKKVKLCFNNPDNIKINKV